ncbi:hypothetical protein DP107_02655 [Haloglomus irregulare]|jgi:hypothetical protein|uniref:HIT zinc finger n=1 Tax=Haloglomus irregulare TaxID=2234134 RepID=A0A554NFD3_9EURY|nr:hypothetical protein [Haloglomus irregulare]TSD16094.1 hypothetical protein DP107_02655 [Haloglomus irregulare]
MSVSGLCQVCEEREMADGCDRCGRLVCERHLEEGSGLCVKCYAELDGSWEGGQGGRSDRGRGPDGVDTYQF